MVDVIDKRIARLLTTTSRKLRRTRSSGDVLSVIDGTTRARCCASTDELTATIGSAMCDHSTPSTELSCPSSSIYFLESRLQDMLARRATWAVQSTAIIEAKLRDIPIAIPPLPEQQRIVGILDEAFEGIATAKANAEKNLQNARALFESHLQSVFTQRGKGWVEKPLGELATFGTDRLSQARARRSSSAIVGMNDFQNGLTSTVDDLDTSYDHRSTIGETGHRSKRGRCSVRSNWQHGLIGRSHCSTEITDDVRIQRYHMRADLEQSRRCCDANSSVHFHDSRPVSSKRFKRQRHRREHQQSESIDERSCWLPLPSVAEQKQIVATARCTSRRNPTPRIHLPAEARRARRVEEVAAAPSLHRQL